MITNKMQWFLEATSLFKLEDKTVAKAGKNVCNVIFLKICCFPGPTFKSSTGLDRDRSGRTLELGRPRREERHPRFVFFKFWRQKFDRTRTRDLFL